MYKSAKLKVLKFLFTTTPLDLLQSFALSFCAFALFRENCHRL